MKVKRPSEPYCRESTTCNDTAASGSPCTRLSRAVGILPAPHKRRALEKGGPTLPSGSFTSTCMPRPGVEGRKTSFCLSHIWVR